MADRRMLARTITENDNFVALPAAAQALYMHLTLSADDDGFCNQIATAMYRAHAKKKDLEALVSARYLIRFDNGVMVIKHWRMANQRRADRYTPTVYQEEYQRLTIKPNNAYTMADNWQPSGTQTATVRQPSGTHLEPQKRIEENRREEKRSINNPDNTNLAHTRTREAEEDDDRFDEFWTVYPRKSGDIREAYFEYLGAIQHGATEEEIIQAVKDQTKVKEAQFFPAADKWLRNKGWTEKPEAPKTKSGLLTTIKPPKVDVEELEKFLASMGGQT